MFKLMVLSLILNFSHAEEKPIAWHEMIAGNKHTETQIDTAILKFLDIEADQLEQQPNTKEILSIRDINANPFIEFYQKGYNPYFDKAAASLKGKKLGVAAEDEDYKAFRQFVIYGQKNPKLYDIMADDIVNNSKSHEKLLPTLLQDSNSEIRSSLARAFWRKLAMRAENPDEYYDLVKIFMENSKKDELLHELKMFDFNGFLSDEFRPCSPQFWSVARMVLGEKHEDKTKIGGILNKRVENLTDRDRISGTVVVEDGNHREEFLSESAKAFNHNEGKLIAREENRDKLKAGQRKVLDDDRAKHEKERARLNRAEFAPDYINENIKDCSTSKNIYNLTDDDVKKLVSDSVYRDRFWKANLREAAKAYDTRFTKSAPFTLKDDEDDLKWLQQTINYMANKNGIVATDPKGKKAVQK